MDNRILDLFKISVISVTDTNESMRMIYIFEHIRIQKDLYSQYKIVTNFDCTMPEIFKWLDSNFTPLCIEDMHMRDNGLTLHMYVENEQQLIFVF